MTTKTYSTGEAAAAVGISRQTLQGWIAKRKLKAPRSQTIANVRVRVWTESDIAQLRQAKERIYLKEMGRPRKKR